MIVNRPPLPLLCTVVLAVLLAWTGCSPTGGGAQAEADRFLELHGSLLQGIYSVASEAEWKSSTDVGPEHDGERIGAGKALAKLEGNAEVIATARRLLDQREQLDDLTVRQLEALMLSAAESPGTIPDIVAARVEGEARQASTLDGFAFCVERREGRCVEPITANGIDNELRESRDLTRRMAIWTASKETGPVLKPGLIELRDLRNRVAREMGYDSFYALQVADYGMTVDEMQTMLQGWIDETRPLYEQLHCYAKHVLADRYGQPVPGRIPAHWIDNRWAQSWGGIVDGVDLDPLFADKSAPWIVETAESFYRSMGFPELPDSFWDRSDLYPVDPTIRKKNTHASAWHMDLEDDVRSLMSVEPNSRWFGTSHHELGHIYYYMAYTRPEVPVLLRAGANRGFHEGIGELITIAAMQVPYLRQVGILSPDQEIDQTAWLLNEALSESLMFLPWAAGTMSSWEHDLYAEELPPDQFNARWWDYVARYQGVDPPADRGSDGCDGCTKTHVNDDPAQYYDYAFASVLKYQLHDHISREILGVDPHEANYYGSREVGDFLRSILEPGRTEDWRELLRRTTGEELSARAMLDYFEPLMAHLEQVNAGRDCSWE